MITENGMQLDELKGVGEKTKELFAKAGICSVEDLLSFYPRTYEQFEAPREIASLREGETAAVRIRLTAPLTAAYKRGKNIVSGLVGDGSGTLTVIWYRMPYLKNTLRTGRIYLLRGSVRKRGALLVMEQPAVYSEQEYESRRLKKRPVYSMVKGLTTYQISKVVQQALSVRALSREYLPESIRSAYGLCEYNYAMEQIHFPDGEKDLEIARKRLVFDEFFFFLLQLQRLKERRKIIRTRHRMKKAACIESILSNLPYELTAAQKKVWEQIETEFMGDAAAARLIQGDVGSGKTIIAMLSLLMTAENGLQGALMVPTEVLARQHFQSVQELIWKNDLPYQAVLLTGSMKAKEKREACRKIAEGEASVIIGTHALIQEGVVYQNLALVITDEQHRFGVRQRETFAAKGEGVHTIVMSATPIPRTLAVILYGDLDISVINELPANRLPIKNCVVTTEYRQKAYRFLADQIAQGHQAYIICPMVEESEAMEAENVTEYCEQLSVILPQTVTVTCLHGKMKTQEKNDIMERFLKNEIQVLVSTTVVEVGVNVPNATVMMVENSERFGLAQLHQLRGRVGRGKDQSYCIFVHTLDGKHIRERLDILNHSNDGFEIANKDLALRGPGDLFGIRQSGMMDFVLGDIYQDAALLGEANEAVVQMLAEDFDLVQKEHELLRVRLERIQKKQSDTINL